MNERKLRRFCTAMILFAMLTRLLGGVGAGRFAFSEDSAEVETRVWPVRLLAAKPADEPSDEIAELPAENSEPPERQIAAEVTKLPEAFSTAEADAITIAGACSYAVDKAALLTRPSALTAKADGPKVLIVHTHTSEAYTPEPGWEYESSDPLRTGDAEHSVVRLGTRVAELLNAHGIETLHDTALNDYPSYNGAYERMRQTIEGYLTQYPSIEMVLDLHRDAANDPAGMPVAFTAEVDGARCAQLMLVVGTDEGGLTHPDWKENLANALKLQALLNRIAPGLCRDIDLRTERFNQHETPGSLLVEFGCTGNTLAEALRSADYLAQALCAFWDMIEFSEDF